eukprot:gene6316-7479_t
MSGRNATAANVPTASLFPSQPESGHSRGSVYLLCGPSCGWTTRIEKGFGTYTRAMD